ncbi:MAG: hypothetical protein CMN76_12125 [Spirochaetaceae bacterium]|nr:hypothetical protein [Spirochaetaceae bacterium]
MRIKENSLLSRVLTATLPWIIYTLQRMVRLTIQKKYLNAEPFERIRQSKEPYILAVWHCCVLWAPFFHRNHGIKAMISPSRDGEIIARVVESSGNQCVRGSSGKNGARALKTLIGLLKDGHPACIVPDGPLGPAFQAKAGIVALGRSTKVAIIPFHYEGTRQWVANHAWDKHRIPAPFCKLYMSYGDPIYLDPGENQDLTLSIERIQSAMMENMYRCQKAAGMEPGRDT